MRPYCSCQLRLVPTFERTGHCHRRSSLPCNLAPLKFCRPLREKRIGPFAKIRGSATSGDCAALVLHLRLEAILRAERQELLGVAERGGRSLGDAYSVFSHF